MKKVERRLGDNEKMTWLLDQAAPMNFVIVGRVEGELSLQAVKESLDGLAQMHPLLTTHIEQRVDGPWVVTNDKLRPSLTVIERADDEHWHRELEKEINTPFDCYTGPLLRVTLLHSSNVSEILFTFYHSISDANSGVYALRDFLTLAGSWKSGLPLVVPPAYPVRPAIEELLPAAARGWSKFSKTLALIAKQAVGNFSDRPQKLSAVATPRNQRTTKIIHKYLPAEMVDQLTAKCREHNTTVQGSLVASTLLSIARKIDKAPLTLSCCSVADLRKTLNPVLGDEIGMLASGVITAHKLRPTPEFWSLAQEVKQVLNRGIASGEIYINLSLVGSLIPKNAPPDAFADKVTDVFRYVSIVTNIGRVEIPDRYGALKLEQLHFAVSLKSVAGEEFNLAAATFVGKMYLNFIYTAPNIADKLAHEVADDMMAILEENLGLSGQ